MTQVAKALAAERSGVQPPAGARALRPGGRWSPDTHELSPKREREERARPLSFAEGGPVPLPRNPTKYKTSKDDKPSDFF